MAKSKWDLLLAALSCSGNSELLDCLAFLLRLRYRYHSSTSPCSKQISVCCLLLRHSDWLTGKYRVENFQSEAKVWFKKMYEVMLSFSLIMLTLHDIFIDKIIG